MSGASVHLRPAAPIDLPFVMATERLPGYEHLVGRWDEALHRAALADPASAVLIALDPAGEARGFAILRDLDDPHGNVLLKRIALAAPGRGLGRPFLAAVLAAAFARPATHRVHLRVFPDNARARRLYAAAGLREEGVMRESFRRPDGTRVAQIAMSVLRPEWHAPPDRAGPDAPSPA